jgi:hypothetical protein
LHKTNFRPFGCSYVLKGYEIPFLPSILSNLRNISFIPHLHHRVLSSSISWPPAKITQHSSLFPHTHQCKTFSSQSQTSPNPTASSKPVDLRLPMLISDIHRTGKVGQELTVRGWVRTVRQQKQNCFLELSDGSHQLPIQVVTSPDLAKGTTTGCSVEVEGRLVESPAGKQKIEIHAQQIRLVGPADPEAYPLAKKRHSFEFLREIPHLRPRTNTFGAVMRVRDAAAFGIRQFFKKHGFIEIHTPILTSSDCEGAGEQFTVSASVRYPGNCRRRCWRAHCHGYLLLAPRFGPTIRILEATWPSFG